MSLPSDTADEQSADASAAPAAPYTPPSSSPTSSKSASDEGDSLETEQVVVFQLESEDYAAPILDVQEIIPTGDITPFPNAPAYVAGIINIRGTVATVVNLAKRFGITQTEKEEGQGERYIILTNVGRSLYGIMVDDVTSVMKIPRNHIRAAEGVTDSAIGADFVDGIAVVDRRIILILDFSKILDEEALLQIKNE